MTSVDTLAEASTDELGGRLLAAAAEVFAERGYDGAGVAEIARRAGVTTGAIYSRYRGKAELLVAALDAHTTDQLDALFADHRIAERVGAEPPGEAADEHLAISGAAGSIGSPPGRTAPPMSMSDIIRIAGSHLVEPDVNASPALLLEAVVAARRHAEVAELMRGRMLDRRARLADIVDTAKGQGGISPAVDTDALVAFCHAVGFGFMVLEALELPTPATEPWRNLITRLVSAVGDGPTGPPMIDLTTTPATPTPHEPEKH